MPWGSLPSLAWSGEHSGSLDSRAHGTHYGLEIGAGRALGRPVNSVRPTNLPKEDASKSYA